MKEEFSSRFDYNVYERRLYDRLAEDVQIRAASQARLTFEILSWPDPSTLHLAWPAGQAKVISLDSL